MWAIHAWCLYMLIALAVTMYAAFTITSMLLLFFAVGIIVIFYKTRRL